jgi:hypothetical protein
MNLAELWAIVPTMTDAELKQLTCCFPSEDTATLLFGQQEMGERQFKIAVRNLSNGTFMLIADVLREMHPDVIETNLYGEEFTPLMEELGPTVDVIPTDEAVAMLPPPPNTRAADFDVENPPQWVQPMPGVEGKEPYSYGSIVSYNGGTYRCVSDFNVWSPEPYPAGYGWVVYPAPPPPTGPLAWVQPVAGVPGKEPYQVGAVVYHPDEATLWESLVMNNVWEPSAAVSTLWKPDAVWTPPDNTAQPWQQPQPGVWPPYEINAQVTHNNKLWTCNYAQNQWEPGATPSYGWNDEGAI